MTVLLVILYVLVCLFLIMVVLLQQGKGADLAGAFGGGGSQTSFGPRSTTNIMHRMTTGAFVLFVVLCLTLVITWGKQGTSIMEGVGEPPPAESSAPAAPALSPDSEAETASGPAADGPAAAGEESAAEGTAPAPGDAGN